MHLRPLRRLGSLSDRPNKQVHLLPGPAPCISLGSRHKPSSPKALGPLHVCRRFPAAELWAAGPPARVKAGTAALLPHRPQAPAQDAPHLKRGNLAAGALNSLGCPPRQAPRPGPATLQSPPMQSSYPVDFISSNWPCNTSEESKKTEVNLEAVFQIVDELHCSSKLEMLKVNTVDNQEESAQQPESDQQMPANQAISNEASCNREPSQLESLTPVASDITSFVVGSEQSITCSLQQASNFLYTAHSNHVTQSTKDATLTVCAGNPASEGTEEVSVKLEKELTQSSSELAVVLVEEHLPGNTLQVRTQLSLLR
ncbi:hypothetical protein NDU88_001696 [Pleurodeles waltl]|uniref:Uncharacterized protein n=1 Tax=Pleurodeles waltl TaxID=8319 RepID=A0AAV7UA78_PLEWA|nr:hypothetical protein NDU88_001696 [Pleurodeles waltl]